MGIAASPIPVVGAAISVAAAATAAGLDWSAQQTHLDIDIKPEDKLVHATNGEVCMHTVVHVPILVAGWHGVAQVLRVA